MSKKTRTIQHDNTEYTINGNGAICNAEDCVQVTAKELDAIHARAVFERVKKPKFPEKILAGWSVRFDIDENGDKLSDGEVAFGCKVIPFAVLDRAHKLSLAARASKTSKSKTAAPAATT